MGIFGGSPQDQVDLDHLKDRVAKLEAAMASLQGQVAALSSGAVAAGGSVPYAGNPTTVSDGALPANSVWLAEVRRLKESGKVINAIKLYREHTGLGLKEAKDAVEGLL
jgi:large subunit ribosomal protein L7/L12